MTTQTSTYEITRFYFDESHPDHHRQIASGLTLAEAQAHCQRDDTHEQVDGQTIWFDGYDQERK